MTSVLRALPSFSLLKIPPKGRIFFYIALNVLCLSIAFHGVSWLCFEYFEKEAEYAELSNKLQKAQTLTHKHQALLTNSFLQGQYEKLKQPYEQDEFEEWLQDFCKEQGCSAVLSLSSNTHHTHSDHRSILAIPLSFTIQSFTDRDVFLLMHDLVKQSPYVVEVLNYRIVRAKPSESKEGQKASSDGKSKVFPFEAKIDTLVLNLVE